MEMEPILRQEVNSLCVVDTGDKSEVANANTSANFRKNSKMTPMGILRGPGETDSWKKPEDEYLVSDWSWILRNWIFSWNMKEDIPVSLLRVEMKMRE